MKIMILNSSGNVGKSTIARELFYPRLTNPLIVEVETVNKSTKDFQNFNVWKFEANNNFEDFYLKIMETENIIVDIGASNLGEFWRQMSDYAGVEMMFDFFVVPTISTDNVIADTYKTVDFLRKQGIDEDKIKVIFNQVERTVKMDFSTLLKTDLKLNEELFIKKSQLFSDLGLLKKSIKDIYQSDVSFYKNKILNAETPKEKIILIKSDLANRMAHSYIKSFDYIFEQITDLKCDLKAILDVNSNKDSKKDKVAKTDNQISEDDEEL